MKTFRSRAPFPLVLIAALPLLAHGDPLDTLQFRVGQSVQHDSNVFRLSDTANTQALLGTSERSDEIAVTTLGIKLDKSYSLQRFELEATVDDYNYSRFSNLDFTALNYAAAWRWSLTPAFRGNLTSDRREYVDHTADVQNNAQLNRRTLRSTLLDAEYELGASWRLVGGVFERSNTSSSPLTFEADSTVRGTEAGVRYITSAGSSLAYRYRDGQGEYSGRAAALGTDFEDSEHEFRAEWAPSGRTSVQARVSHLDRKHQRLPQRDFSGFTGQLSAAWDITGKTRLTGGVTRELGSYQAATASYFEGYRFFVSPLWRVTEKTSLRARYDRAVREYKGPLAGVAPVDRRDTLQLASLSLEWQALRSLALRATVQRDKRRSNLPGFDYTSNAVILSALARF
jgi:exopolysaccharide biosynthesis operon protein EpsL